MKEKDVVDLLLRQHTEIKALFDEVENAAPEDKAEAFRRLVRLPAVHETAEEEIVHPYARRKLDHGDEIVDERLAEEHSAKDMLTQMERAGVGDDAHPPARRGGDGAEEPPGRSARRHHGQDPGPDPHGDGQARLRAARIVGRLSSSRLTVAVGGRGRRRPGERCATPYAPAPPPRNAR